MKIVVIGKSGQLASELSLLKSEHQVVCLGRDDINITDAAACSDSLRDAKPDAIINASAYTAVDKAESDKDAAYALNHIAVKNLSDYCANNDCHLVHVSTDYVFRGDKGSPYLSDDVYEPLGVYGASKAAGEQELINNIPKLSCIIRTSWVYSCIGNNFVKTMLRLMNEKPELGVIDDQIGSPTWAKSLAQACLYAVENKVSGIHHWTDAGVASWYDFAVTIQRLGMQKGLIEHSIPIRPIPTTAYPTPAARPHYSVLDKSSLANEFAGVENKHWEVQLSAMLDELVASSN